MRIISASIDLSKIDKNKIVPGKNGAKYYNIDIIVNDTANAYGQDVSISLPQSKEERADKAKKTYIGNGKTVWKNEPAISVEATEEPNIESSASASDKDLPF